MENKTVFILYFFYCTNSQQEVVEQLSAVPVDEEQGWYCLQSIPLFAKSLAVGDVVQAMYDNEEQALVLTGMVAYSGHSTIQVVVEEEDKTAAVMHQFKDLGCHIEAGDPLHFAIDIPVSQAYEPVINKLLELQQSGTLDFREACLSEQHRAQVS